MWFSIPFFRYDPKVNREFKIPGRLTSRTLTLSARDWVDDDYLGGKLFTLRSRFQAEDDNVLFIMASLRKTREMIVIAYAEGLLMDEEFMFLYETNQPVNLELPYYEYEEFNFDENISEAECKAEFRFERGDIERLADVLQLPPTWILPHWRNTSLEQF